MLMFHLGREPRDDRTAEIDAATGRILAASPTAAAIHGNYLPVM